MTRTWTDEELAIAIATCTSWRQVNLALGMRGSSPRRFRRRAQEIGLDFSHFRGRRSFTDEELRKAAETSSSIVEIRAKLGCGNHQSIVRHMKLLGLSVDKPSRPASWKPLQEILVENSTYRGHILKNRLLEEGIKEAKCEWCGLTEWLGGPIPLQLDHINGVNNDHRLENLRILCPNCHDLTPTWGFRGRKKNS